MIDTRVLYDFTSINPTSSAVTVGDSTEIHCRSDGFIQWSKDGVSILMGYRVTVLQLHNVSEDDSGIYQCRGRTRLARKPFKASSEILVGGIEDNVES